MSDLADRTVVTFRGQSPPVEPDRALEILRHVDEYEPPAEYSTGMSNLTGLGPDDVDFARLTWGDHVPDASDPSEVEPHTFSATYGDGRVRVMFKTTPGALDVFGDALDHVFEVTPLDVEELDAEAPVDEWIDIDDVDTPGEGFSVGVASGPSGTTVSLSAMSDAVEDPTTTFSLAEEFDPDVEAVADQVEELAGPVEETVLTIQARTRPLDADEAAALLEHVDGYEAPEYDDRVASAGAFDPESVADAVLAWGDGLPEQFADEPEPNLFHAVYDADPHLFYVSYDEADDRQVAVAVRATRESLAEVDDFLAHVFEVEPLEPERVATELDTGTDYEFDFDEVDPPDGVSTMTGTGSVTVSTKPGALVEDTSTTFSLEALFGPPLEEFLDQVGAIISGEADDGVDWDRVDELRGEYDPAGETPEGTVERLHVGPGGDASVEDSVAYLLSIGHSEGIFEEEFVREQFEFEEGGSEDVDEADVETRVRHPDLDPDEVEEVLEEYDDLAMALGFMGIDGDDLADLARREQLALVELETPDGVETKVVATEGGEWKVVY